MKHRHIDISEYGSGIRGNFRVLVIYVDTKDGDARRDSPLADLLIRDQLHLKHIDIDALPR